jgi:hypothetical protein
LKYSSKSQKIVNRKGQNKAESQLKQLNFGVHFKMSKITIANLETAEVSIQELTATELDATKGGLLDGLKVKDTTVGLVAVDDVLNHSLNGNSILNGNDVKVSL